MGATDSRLWDSVTSFDFRLTPAQIRRLRRGKYAKANYFPIHPRKQRSRRHLKILEQCLRHATTSS